MSDDDIITGFVSELRRGTVVLGVLNQLSTPKYGYSLGQELTEKGVPVDGNTLYPLLRRLEKQGLLQSEWDMSGEAPQILCADSERHKNQRTTPGLLDRDSRQYFYIDEGRIK